MKYDFIDYAKQSLKLEEVLEAIDACLSQVALPREQALAFHIALQQVLEKLKKENDGR